MTALQADIIQETEALNPVSRGPVKTNHYKMNIRIYILTPFQLPKINVIFMSLKNVFAQVSNLNTKLIYSSSYTVWHPTQSYAVIKDPNIIILWHLEVVWAYSLSSSYLSPE